MTEAADAEHEAVDGEPARHRGVAILVGALVLAIAITAMILATRLQTEPKFCTAEGRAGPNPGQIYGHDVNQGCKVVDEHGNVLPEQYQ